jgi:phenylalanine-4-hydroxylase
VGPYKTKALTPGKRSYMAEVQKSANEMITNIRDAAFNMAKTISETYDIDTLQPREAYQVAISLKSLNEVVLTNNLFLKNNIDLSTLTDEELIQLAESMKMKVDESKSKAEAIEVEST